MSVDSDLYEPIKSLVINRVVRTVCASCHKLFDQDANNLSEYCSDCGHHHNWSACVWPKASLRIAQDQCCGGYCLSD
jgi:rRNA maturation endonuclease Nob1